MFYVDESKNLNSALWQSCWRHGVSRTLKISFSYFFVFGLVFCFVGYCGMVLVSWFQWWSAILAAQGYFLWVVWSTVLGEDWCKDFKGAKEGGEEKDIWSWLRTRKVDFWRGEEAKFLFFLIIRTCGVALEIHSNQFGGRSCSGLLPFMNLTFRV